MNATLHFFGAAGTVTGSRYLLEAETGRFLIDCGMFQGGSALKSLNWKPFAIPPESIEAVFLTHAHIDHSGFLPRLVKQGFRGPVYATQATCALLRILLMDAAHLQEQEAGYANKKGYSRHKPALPLFDQGDAQETISRLHPVCFNDETDIFGLNVLWTPAGHILGSAILSVGIPDHHHPMRIVFSGDLGRYDDEVMAPPAKISHADYLLIESTYGDRVHNDKSVDSALGDVVNYIVHRKGMLIIPAFAVGRTQGILYRLRKLQEGARIPGIPIYIDSPMAVDVSGLYCQFGDDHNLDVNLLMDHQACPLRCKDTVFVREVEESKELNLRAGPGIIISASGMCTGGRILHHLKNRLPNEENLVLIVGYQAEGSLGRRLQDGAERVRIHGETMPVRARIASLAGLSAHGDQRDLLSWLSNFQEQPVQTFIVHGENQSSAGFQQAIREKLGWNSHIPELGESVTLV
jgi:metallo-beta-lactamase family protein